MRGRDTAASGALVVFWSSGFIGAELGTTYAPADTLLAWRYVVVGVLLVAALWWRGIRPDRATVQRQAGLGLLCQAGFLGLIVTGVGLGVPPGTAALMAAMQPLVVASLAGPVLGELVSWRQWCALGAGLGGVALVVGGDLGAATAPLWAYALPVGGMLALSAGTLLGRRWRAPETLLESLALQSLVAGVVFVTVATARAELTPPMSVGFWSSVVWVVFLSSFGGYGAYLLVLRRSGATRVSTLLYLTPPTTMLWAWAMFGDRVTWLGVLGLVVCAVSVTVVLRADTSLVSDAPPQVPKPGRVHLLLADQRKRRAVRGRGGRDGGDRAGDGR